MEYFALMFPLYGFFSQMVMACPIKNMKVSKVHGIIRFACCGKAIICTNDSTSHLKAFFNSKLILLIDAVIFPATQ